jgi:hypothetical protein
LPEGAPSHPNHRSHEHPAFPDRAATGPADVDRLVSGYCSAWNEADPECRLRRLRAVWNEHATFDNVEVHVRGLQEMAAHIGAFWAGHPGWRFVVVDVTAHGRHLHLTWKLLDPAGRERLTGHDVGECSADRRLDRVVSFWRTETDDDAQARARASAAAELRAPAADRRSSR